MLYLLLFALLILFFAYISSVYSRERIYEDSERLERITGVAFPKLNLVKSTRSGDNFMGDYEDVFVLKMRENLSESTFYYLDSIIECGDTHWYKFGEKYEYRNMWGNGFSAPPGENAEDDHFLEINIEKGSRIINLRWGVW